MSSSADYELASPNQSTIYAIAIVLPCIATFAVAARFYVRQLKKSPYQGDDWTILIAAFLTWGLGAVMIVGAALDSLGTHTVINPKTGKIIGSVHEMYESMLNYAYILIMIVTYGIIKLSVLLFYRRIFISNTFRRISLVLLVLVILWSLAFLFATAFQCGTHTSAWWTGPVAINKYCVKYASLELGFATSDIITDLVVLALPIPIIWHLQMASSQKIGVTMIFLLGLLSTAAAVVRLYWVIKDQFSTTTGSRDLIAVESNVIVYSQVEAGIGVVAACLPTLRPLFHGKAPESLINSLRSAFSLRSLSPQRRRGSDSENLPSHAAETTVSHDKQVDTSSHRSANNGSNPALGGQDTGI